MERYLIIKLLKMKDKEKMLKAPIEKWHITNKGKTIWMTANFSSEMMEARRKWHCTFSVLKELSTENSTSGENIIKGWKGN